MGLQPGKLLPLKEELETFKHEVLTSYGAFLEQDEADSLEEHISWQLTLKNPIIKCLNDSIQKLLSTMGLNDTIEVSGEQMTFSEIIEKIYLQDSESKLIKLNLNNYGMIFVG